MLTDCLPYISRETIFPGGVAGATHNLCGYNHLNGTKWQFPPSRNRTPGMSGFVTFFVDIDDSSFVEEKQMSKLGKGKQAQKDRAKAILAKMANRQRVAANADHQFILDLLKNHPERDEKIGSGVEAFLCLVLYDGNKCFGIVRTDGSEARFSVNACLTPPTSRANFQKAFRNVVSDQSLNFYAQYKANTPEDQRTCPITGDTITDENHAVDHCGPLFAEILDEWTRLNNIDIDAVAYEEHPTRDMFFRPVDFALRQSFDTYHRERAEFRVLTKRGNGQVEAERPKAPRTSNGGPARF